MSAPKKRPSVIYAIQCVETGKVYIGCTEDFETRIRTHFVELLKGEKTRFVDRETGRVKSDWQKDFDRFGKDAFKVFILEKDVKPSNAYERETYWMEYYGARNSKFGYNTNSGQIQKPKIVVEPGMPDRMACKLPKAE